PVAQPASRPAWQYVLVGSVLGPLIYLGAQRLGKSTPHAEGGAAANLKPAHGVTTRELPVQTHQPWIDRGYAEMVAPLRLPSRLDDSSAIEIWLKLPDQGKITVKHLPDQKRDTLVYPPGTIADRLELLEAGKRVADVRGTELFEGGREAFHVY